MSKNQLNPFSMGNGAEKVWRLIAPAFFVGALAVHAQNNQATGVFTSVPGYADAGIITSPSNGNGTLNIRNSNTTNLILRHNISGNIAIRNNVESFILSQQQGTISESTLTALRIDNAQTIYINDANFEGVSSTNSGGIYNFGTDGFNTIQADESAANGALITGSTNVIFARGSFSGDSYQRNAQTSGGTAGMAAYNSRLTFASSGSGTQVSGGHAYDSPTGDSSGGTALLAISSTVNINQGTFNGGDGGDALITSRGGTGLEAWQPDSALTIVNGTFNGGDAGNSTTNTFGGDGAALFSASVLITNGTFTGGDSGEATAYSYGGHGLYATNSTFVEIVNGTFNGGDAVNATNAAAGLGLFTTDTQLTIQNGTFSGGIVESNEAAASVAVYARDSRIWIMGGDYNKDSLNPIGLVSEVTEGNSETITLDGGNFRAIAFTGAGNQTLRVDEELKISDFIVVYDGTLNVENNREEYNQLFQTNFIQGGQVTFSEDFILGNEGYIQIETNALGVRSLQNIELLSDSTVLLFADEQGLVSGSLEADQFFLQEGANVLINTTNLYTLSDGTTITSTVMRATSASDGFYLMDTNEQSVAANSTNLIDSGIFNVESERLIGVSAVELNNNQLDLIISSKSLRDYFNATGSFGVLADELNQNEAFRLIVNNASGNNEYLTKRAQRTYLTVPNTYQAILKGAHTATGQTGGRCTEFRDELSLPSPAGAAGPHRSNEMRGWIKYYGQLYSRDDDGLNAAYESSINGFSIGIDRSFDNLLLGVSGGSGFYNITGQEIDFDSDISAYHGAFYGTYGGDWAFLDFGLAYGHNEVETQTAEPFVVKGDFQARTFSAHVGAGYDLVDDEGSTVFTPEASLQYTYYVQDSYSERGEDETVPRNFDEFSATSLRSSLGINVSMLERINRKSIGIKVDGRVHWLHEFNADPGNINFNLEGGTDATYQLAAPALDENIYRIGVGCTFFNTMRGKPKNVLFRADFDELFGDGFNSHNLTAKVVYAF